MKFYLSDFGSSTHYGISFKNRNIIARIREWYKRKRLMFKIANRLDYYDLAHLRDGINLYIGKQGEDMATGKHNFNLREGWLKTLKETKEKLYD